MFENTVPLEDTVALDSPITESGLLSIGMNTQVLNGCESAQQSGDQMDDCVEKYVALDSDDEGENRVNECFGATGRFSGRDGIGLLRRQQAPAGCFRRLNKVRKHVSEKCDEESISGRIGLCNDYRFEEHCMVVDSVVSSSSDQKPVLMNQEDLDVKKESWTEELLEKKLSSSESKYMDLGKDTNYECKRAELNYSESPQVAESQDKALRFVENYLSVCDLGSQKDIPTRKADMIKSPPCLRSKGAQSLARRLTLGSTASKLTTFDWTEKQIDKAECASLRLYKDSANVFRDEKSGFVTVSVNQESPSVKLHNEISSLQSEEKLPENMSSPNNLDTVLLSSNGVEKVGLNSGMCLFSMKSEEQPDAGVSGQNAENVEQLRLTPDDLYIGLDTQMAAEAMEELGHACFTHQDSNNTPLDTSIAVNNKSKSNVASQEVAFVDWRCKKKRSKTMKISTVRDKRLCRVAAKRFKNQQDTVSQPPVGKNLMTKKLMAEEFFKKRTENTINRKTAAPSRMEYGITERYHMYSRRPKETADDIKYDPFPKGKKISNSFHAGSHRKGINRTCLKSNYRSSFEVEKEAAKGKENFDLNVADKTHSELKPWIHPKGKRTHPRTPRHAVSASNQSIAFTSIDNNLKKYPLEESVGRLAKLLVYNRRCKVSLGREHTGTSLKLAVDLSSCVADSAVPGRKEQIPSESDAKKPLKQHCTPNDASFDMKADLLSKGHSVTLQAVQGSAKRRRLSLSPLSRSPLMKELSRLGYTDSLPDFLPKDSRRRKATEKVCILFSQNLDTSKLKQQKKIVARLGFSIASSPSDATHFVADRFVRTRNMLEAIGLGKPVVTHLWLESCEQVGYTIDEKSYILRDEKKEKEIGFNMHVSLTRARQLPLLKGRRVVITPNVKPGMEVINSLIKAVQGELVQYILNAKTKDKPIQNDVLILSSAEDYTICCKYLQKGASIYDSELLLNGIVTQELEYERYRLFKDRIENGH